MASDRLMAMVQDNQKPGLKIHIDAERKWMLFYRQHFQMHHDTECSWAMIKNWSDLTEN